MTNPKTLMTEKNGAKPKVCECVECCDGEHPGDCKECAGWGEISGDECSYCDGLGICPMCDGKSRNSVEG